MEKVLEDVPKLTEQVQTLQKTNVMFAYFNMSNFLHLVPLNNTQYHSVPLKFT